MVNELPGKEQEDSKTLAGEPCRQMEAVHALQGDVVDVVLVVLVGVLKLEVDRALEHLEQRDDIRSSGLLQDCIHDLKEQILLHIGELTFVSFYLWLFRDDSEVQEIDLHFGLFGDMVVVARVGVLAELLHVHEEVELVSENEA